MSENEDEYEEPEEEDAENEPEQDEDFDIDEWRIKQKKLEILDRMLKSLDKEEKTKDVWLAIQENKELEEIILQFWLAIEILAKLQANRCEATLEVDKDLMLTRGYRFWKKEKEIDFENFGEILSSGEDEKQ
jgi:hypothetical protein